MLADSLKDQVTLPRGRADKVRSLVISIWIWTLVAVSLLSGVALLAARRWDLLDQWRLPDRLRLCLVLLTAALVVLERDNLQKYNLSRVSLLFSGLGCTALSFYPTGPGFLWVVPALGFFAALIAGSFRPLSRNEWKWVLLSWVGGTCVGLWGVISKYGDLHWYAASEPGHPPLMISYLYFFLVYVSIAMPVELVFRGFLWGELRGRLPRFWVLLITTLLFWASNIAFVQDELVFWFIFPVAALACGLLAERSKSIIPSGVLRAAFNALIWLDGRAGAFGHPFYL